MTVFFVWTSHPLTDLVGPWEEAREAAAGVTLVDSSESLSAVYHAVKWALPQEAALMVIPVPQTPKSRGLRPGTTAWLRSRTSSETFHPSG